MVGLAAENIVIPNVDEVVGKEIHVQKIDEIKADEFVKEATKDVN